MQNEVKTKIRFLSEEKKTRIELRLIIVKTKSVAFTCSLYWSGEIQVRWHIRNIDHLL